MKFKLAYLWTMASRKMWRESVAWRYRIEEKRWKFRIVVSNVCPMPQTKAQMGDMSTPVTSWTIFTSSAIRREECLIIDNENKYIGKIKCGFNCRENVDYRSPVIDPQMIAVSIGKTRRRSGKIRESLWGWRRQKAINAATPCNAKALIKLQVNVWYHIST